MMAKLDNTHLFRLFTMHSWLTSFGNRYIILHFNLFLEVSNFCYSLSPSNYKFNVKNFIPWFLLLSKSRNGKRPGALLTSFSLPTSHSVATGAFAANLPVCSTRFNRICICRETNNCWSFTTNCTDRIRSASTKRSPATVWPSRALTSNGFLGLLGWQDPLTFI